MDEIKHRISRFLEIVGSAPKPSPEFIDDGAYPFIRDDGGYHVNVDEIAGIVDAYFERTKTVTTDFERAVRSTIHLADFLTNEKEYAHVLADVRQIGGVYVGVSRALSFTFPAWQGAQHAFVTDYDIRVPVGFVPLYGALMAMAPTRAHFVSLLFGSPLKEGTEEDYLRMSGEDLIREIWMRPRQTKFIEAVQKTLESLLVRNDIPRSRQVFESMKKAFFSMHTLPQTLNVLANRDEEGRGGALSGEMVYMAERKLFLDGRITGAAVDLAGEEMNILLGAVQAMGAKGGIAYISNVESWLWHDIAVSHDKKRMERFYRNLARLGEMWSGLPMLISSISGLRPILLDLNDYVERSSAYLDMDIIEGHELFNLRKNSMHVESRGDYLDGCQFAIIEELKRDVEGTFKDVLEDVLILVGDEPVSTSYFNEKMEKESAAFRRLSQKAKDVLIRLLTGSGVIDKTTEDAVSVGGGQAGQNVQTGRGSRGPMHFRPDFNYPVTNSAFISQVPMHAVFLGGALSSGFGLPMTLI